MSENNTFKLLFLVLFILVLIVRAYFGIKQRQIGQSSWSVNEDAVSREGRWSLLLRPVAFLFMLGLIVLYFIEPSGSAWLFLPLPLWLRFSGVLLGAAGILLLIWVHRTLGMQWSTTLQFKEGHTLNTSGPYEFIRHPMYASLFLFFLGLSIMSSFWPLMALVVILLLFFNRIMGREEAMMIEEFGEEYRVYMKSTGRFLPRLR
ncbi:MAG: isoprenylcysteine carboxylmethyltransferase family protein [Chloroflexota bacterium]|nr:isoprenylcysteine carboxylmethyltransferase family protein [Chloroflexota bacterium]